VAKSTEFSCLGQRVAEDFKLLLSKKGKDEHYKISGKRGDLVEVANQHREIPIEGP